jgi:hypothetical protein
MTTPGHFYVTRHEMGHNMGHAHHGANIYDWRLGVITMDGFDLMSGGGYDTSDFAAASKWHYNWIPDSAVVVLQSYTGVANLVLQAFDNPNVVPSATNIMAVHIPLLGELDNTGLFSYWLSYRGSSVAGRARKGLSVHLTSLYGFGGPFAAYYDSVNFDAVGDTPETTDSFVLPNTCYVLTPPVMLMKVNYDEAQRIRPVVCVNDIELGASITISVSFIDPKASTTSPFLSSQQTLGCGAASSTTAKSLDASNGKRHLLSFTGTGQEGRLALSFCRDAGSTSSVTAYFYDS